MRRTVVIVLASAALGATAAGCSEGSTASSSRETVTSRGAPTALTRYSLIRTRRCLEQRGLLVAALGKRNARLQALSDLAQRTSVGVRRGADVVGLAFGNAELLADLLAVPNDRYVIETRGNAVLLYPRSARALASTVVGCLRS